LRVEGSEFRVQGLGFGVWNLVAKIMRVEELGSAVIAAAAGVLLCVECQLHRVFAARDWRRDAHHLCRGTMRVQGLFLGSGSEAGSYLRLIDLVYHSTLGLRVIKKKFRVCFFRVLGLGR